MSKIIKLENKIIKLDELSELGIIRFATLDDIPYIIDLAKKETRSLGFIPKPAYTSAITGIKTGKRWSKKCNDKLWVCECNGDLVGFVLASFGRPSKTGKVGKIAQICLQPDARMMERGRNLLQAVIDYGQIVGTFKWSCGCADDLESNIFWKTMGWIKVGDRMGISHKNTWKQTSGRKINIYNYPPPDLYTNGTENESTSKDS